MKMRFLYFLEMIVCSSLNFFASDSDKSRDVSFPFTPPATLEVILRDGGRREGGERVRGGDP